MDDPRQQDREALDAADRNLSIAALAIAKARDEIARARSGRVAGRTPEAPKETR